MIIYYVDDRTCHICLNNQGSNPNEELAMPYQSLYRLKLIPQRRKLKHQLLISFATQSGARCHKEFDTSGMDTP